MILNKRKILIQLEMLGEKLRTHPKEFMSIEGTFDYSAINVRLNRLGKCISIAAGIVSRYADGVEFTPDEQREYDGYLQYLKECHQAFEIGKTPEKKR